MAWSEGERSVAATGSVIGSIIVTGDGNLILHHGGGELLRFVLLDDDFRQAQRAHKPTIAFYDGVRANWAVIAAGMDAPRTLMGELLAFVEEAAQDGLSRIGLLLGPSGEGKSTLLRHTAWELAERGYAVLWHRRGSLPLPWEPGEGQPLRLPDDGRPLVLCFDDADQVEALPSVVESLRESDRHFVILGATRPNQWELAGMEGLLSPLPHRFELRCLSREEADALLERMEAHGGLGKLAKLPTREARLRALLRTRERELQLLPALISARTGRDFDRIILDVLTRLRKRKDGPFLLRAYLTLAAVHRFGYWMSIALLCQAVGIGEEEMGLRILAPLRGEIIEVEEGEQHRLYPRHSAIAERAFRLARERRWIVERNLYHHLFIALDRYLDSHPQDNMQEKLFTMLPLALRKEGATGELLARTLLREAAQLRSGNPVIFQVLALMEKEVGDFEEARRLFRKATEADPGNAPSWQAWALMEAELGDMEAARQVFRQGTERVPRFAPLWLKWAQLELRAGDVEAARQVFRQGTEKAPQDGQLWLGWAQLELGEGDVEAARRVFRQGTEKVPRFAWLWLSWGRMELKAQQPDAALKIRREALGYFRNRRFRAAFLDIKAQALAALGQLVEAEASFRQARRVDSSNPHILYHFAYFLVQQERQAEACRLYRHLLRRRNIPSWMREGVEDAWARWCEAEEKK